MRNPTRILTLLAVSVLVAPAASARQDVQVRMMPEFRTRSVERGRLDVDDQILRARYRMEDELAVRDPEEFLARAATSFGWAEGGRDLILESERRGASSRHLTYRQTYRGIPVDLRTVKVNLDHEGRVSMVLSAYEPLPDLPDFRTQPELSSSEARQSAWGYLGAEGAASSDPELVVFPGAEPRLAWRLFVWPRDEPAEYRVLVDAATGEILMAVDQAVRDHFYGGDRAGGLFSGDEPGADSSVPAGRWSDAGWTTFSGDEPGAGRTIPAVKGGSAHLERVDGSGSVYIPGPLFRDGVPYGGAYIDNSDQTNAVLDAARVEVVLPDLSQNTEGQFVLVGPYVRIIGQNSSGTTVYTPPSEAFPDQFHYTRAQSGFEAVNAYYHIDASQRYVQSFGLTDRQNGPFRVNPRGLSQDQSKYYPHLNAIELGTGGVDDAEDATVIWHEYAHALLEAVAPGLIGASDESVALHEGWADYWAASYLRYLVESGQVQRTDWRGIFAWDSGDGSIWAGRDMNHMGHYPEDICSDDPGGGACDKHNDGRLWATSLMEVQDVLGRDLTDELVLLSHPYLSAPATFRDAAEAILQADLDYHSGSHFSVLLQVFGDRGLVDAQEQAPVIAHDPLPDTDDLGGERLVGAHVVSFSSTVESVILSWSSPSQGSREVHMMPVGNDRYEALMAIPDVEEAVDYFITATDSEARTSTLPAGAPADTFQFLALIDAEAPVITHNELGEVPMANWPAVVQAVVTDNLGVDRVWVTYEVFDANGTARQSGEFDLGDEGSGAWAGVFPVALDVIERSARVQYRIYALDTAQPNNESSAPDGAEVYEARITATGLLRAYDFEVPDPDIELEGDWEIGESGVDLQPWSGEGMAGTNLSGSYTALPEAQMMILPRINLSGIAKPHLTFWHWFDTEEDGDVDPVQGGGRIWDGGFLFIRTKENPEWAVLGGAQVYTGLIEAGKGNPLAGFRAFGGYSRGWRQVSVPLTSSDSIDVAFVFSSDQGNTETSRSFGGWYVDDIQLIDHELVDTHVPQVSAPPPPLRYVASSAGAPVVTVRAVDNVAVTDAFLDYEVSGAGADQAGTLRMEMGLADFTRFDAALDFLSAPAPGTVVEYAIRLADPAGNELRLPEGAGQTYRIEVRLMESEPVLTGVTVTGGWESLTVGWFLGSETQGDVSSINLPPRDMPENSLEARLELVHSYRLVSGRVGNVKISVDSGRHWEVIEPEEGYDSTADLPGHPMDGERVFHGESSQTRTDVFDLRGHSGLPVHVRLDVMERSENSGSDYWSVEAFRFVFETEQDAFSFERGFRILPNYPNPFRDQTQITFSIPEEADVELAVYDVLGRRVATLVDGAMAEGHHSIRLTSDGLSAGPYLLRLIADGRTTSRPIVIIR